MRCHYVLVHWPPRGVLHISKELFQWNEILIQGIHAVYGCTLKMFCLPQRCWAGNTILFENTMLDSNVICQQEIIPSQDPSNTCVLGSRLWQDTFLLSGESGSLLCLSPSAVTQGALCNYFVLQRWIVLENSESVIQPYSGQMTSASSFFLVLPLGEVASWVLTNWFCGNWLHSFNTGAILEGRQKSGWFPGSSSFDWGPRPWL